MGVASSIRVLVVDDSEAWRNFVSRKLQQHSDLQVVGEVSDGPEAIEAAHELRPHLILLDISLPSLNGLEVARRIRQISGESRIIFMSENRSPEIVEEALLTGAVGYIAKSDAERDLFSAVVAFRQGGHFVSSSLSSPAFIEIRPGKVGAHSTRELGHVVQFYMYDADLLSSLAALFGAVLRSGESVAAVMTSSHRNGLLERLIGQGMDARVAMEGGRLAILDAVETLNGFMDGNEPNRERFLFQVGNVIRNTRRGAVARPLVVFGEMVAVLCAQEKHEAAIKLEQLWNEFALMQSLYLCCAYPAMNFHEQSKADFYADICSEHTDVVSVF